MKANWRLSIIHNLLEEDEDGRRPASHDCRLYGRAPTLEDIREAVRTAMSDVLPDLNLKVIDRPDKARALKAPHTRLLFINKGCHIRLLLKRSSESDLPERLIDEFVDLGKGILANVVLGCIATIREETHRMLARFHPEPGRSFLDAPNPAHDAGGCGRLRGRSPEFRIPGCAPEPGGRY